GGVCRVPGTLRPGPGPHRRAYCRSASGKFRPALQRGGGEAMSEASNIKAELTQSLKALHLPTIRQSYEEVARQAEREALSYERYLHELVERECEERQENRISKMLRESQLPLEKSLAAFETRRLPGSSGILCVNGRPLREGMK